MTTTTTTTTDLTFSNPRTETIIKDWPLGRQQRGNAEFTVEIKKEGKKERIIRRTEKPNAGGAWCQPKKETYAKVVRIVDGSDGKLYILSFNDCLFFQYVNGTLKGYELVFYDGDPKRYQELAELILKPEYAAQLIEYKKKEADEK